MNQQPWLLIFLALEYEGLWAAGPLPHCLTFQLQCTVSVLIAGMLILVLVLKDSLRTFFKSLSLSWSLGVRSLSLSLSLGVQVQEVLVLVLGGQVLVLILILVLVV